MIFCILVSVRCQLKNFTAIFMLAVFSNFMILHLNSRFFHKKYNFPKGNEKWEMSKRKTLKSQKSLSKQFSRAKMKRFLEFSTPSLWFLPAIHIHQSKTKYFFEKMKENFTFSGINVAVFIWKRLLTWFRFISKLLSCFSSLFFVSAATNSHKFLDQLCADAIYTEISIKFAMIESMSNNNLDWREFPPSNFCRFFLLNLEC